MGKPQKSEVQINLEGRASALRIDSELNLPSVELAESLRSSDKKRTNAEATKNKNELIIQSARIEELESSLFLSASARASDKKRTDAKAVSNETSIALLATRIEELEASAQLAAMARESDKAAAAAKAVCGTTGLSLIVQTVEVLTSQVELLELKQHCNPNKALQITTVDGTDLATSLTLLNEIKALINSMNTH